MKKKAYIVVFCGALVALVLGSCKEKKESNTIITTMETIEVSDEVQMVGDTDDVKSFEWGGTFYEAHLSRHADKEAKPVKDDTGNRYYENTLTVRVDGADGVVFNRVFRKEDLTSYIDADYLKPSHSTLMGVAFSRVSGPNAYFVLTVGSPDQMDDEYMLVQLAITKDGGMVLSKIQEND